MKIPGNIVRSASLCPIRVKGGIVEVLLQRREFWNHQHQRPMRYPGEWVFPGGGEEEGDENLLGTAMREFRDEMQYYGGIIRPVMLRKALQSSHERKHYIEFWTAGLDTDFALEIPPNGEIIDAAWMTPRAALAHLRSKEFEAEQLREYKRRGLGDPAYGIYAATARQLPIQNIQTLELIHMLPELKVLYG